MTWRPQPNAGDLRLCRDCRYFLADGAPRFKCGLTKPNPYLPPLVGLRGGREICSQMEPIAAPALTGQQMALEVS